VLTPTTPMVVSVGETDETSIKRRKRSLANDHVSDSEGGIISDDSDSEEATNAPENVLFGLSSSDPEEEDPWKFERMVLDEKQFYQKK